jgi:hypothetical protein
MTEGGGTTAAAVRPDENADAAVGGDEIALEDSEMARKAGRRIMLYIHLRGMVNA